MLAEKPLFGHMLVRKKYKCKGWAVRYVYLQKKLPICFPKLHHLNPHQECEPSSCSISLPIMSMISNVCSLLLDYFFSSLGVLFCFLGFFAYMFIPHQVPFHCVICNCFHPTCGLCSYCHSNVFQRVDVQIYEVPPVISFRDRAFGVISKKYCLTQDHKFPQTSSLRSFIVSGFPFKSVTDLRAPGGSVG